MTAIRWRPWCTPFSKWPGFVVMRRERFDWSAVVRSNGWLAAFYLFWLMSVVWSDYPVITTKRLIKDLGHMS